MDSAPSARHGETERGHPAGDRSADRTQLGRGRPRGGSAGRASQSGSRPAQTRSGARDVESGRHAGRARSFIVGRAAGDEPSPRARCDRGLSDRPRSDPCRTLPPRKPGEGLLDAGPPRCRTRLEASVGSFDLLLPCDRIGSREPLCVPVACRLRRAARGKVHGGGATGCPECRRT